MTRMIENCDQNKLAVLNLVSAVAHLIDAVEREKITETEREDRGLHDPEQLIKKARDAVLSALTSLELSIPENGDAASRNADVYSDLIGAPYGIIPSTDRLGGKLYMARAIHKRIESVCGAIIIKTQRRRKNQIYRAFLRMLTSRL